MVCRPAATSHSIFETLAKAFPSYFHLPLRYDTNTELLTSFRQSSATHLSDHVYEWCRRQNTCHAPPFEDSVYLDWFLRILLSPIGKDVASHFRQTEEESLQTALRYDHIYVQFGYVYIVILDLPRPRSASALGVSHTTDGIVGAISHPSPYTHQSYGYPQGGTSSSNTYVTPTSNMFSGPQLFYQTIAPPYAQPRAPAPQALASQPPMHPQPQQPPPPQGQLFAQQSATNPQKPKHLLSLL